MLEFARELLASDAADCEGLAAVDVIFVLDEEVSHGLDVLVALSLVNWCPCLLDEFVDFGRVRRDASCGVRQEADGPSRAVSQLGKGTPLATLFVT